jgi:myosin-1
VLGGRKERRRYSLVGYRRFLGDYLGIGNNGGPGEMVASAINIPRGEPVLFSCRAELLVSKLGRSSKPEARMLILTSRNVYIVKQVLVNRQVQIVAERTMTLGAIKFVGCSNLKDDWFSLGVGSPQEADPLINCVFKTEFFTHLKNATRGAVDLRIGPQIDYAKKPGKMAVVKVQKDPNVPRDDLYKSGTIHTGQGEAPNSMSRPTPKGKQKPARAITTGKLLKAGGPGGQMGKLSAAARGQRPGGGPTPAAQSRPVPQAQPASQNRVVPQFASQPAAQGRPVPQAQPGPATNGYSNHAASASTSSNRGPPPPPPPPVAPAAAPREPSCKALYDFNGQTGGEMSVKKDDVVIIVQKENNGSFYACPNY